MNQKNNNFEENLKALSEVVKTLEAPDLSLTNALNAFEEGIGFYKACIEKLDQADEKVKLLIESHELGEMVEVDFED